MLSPPRPRQTLVAIEAHGATDTGRKRQHNEDAHGIYPADRLFVLVDGMGGTAGGAVAAALSVDALASFVRGHRRAPREVWPHAADPNRSRGANLAAVGLKVANDKVRAAARADAALSQMGATAAALLVGEAAVAVAHVGDVRVYRLREATLERLTIDHTVREEVRAMQPDITEEELAAIPQRDLVTRVIGMADEIEPTVASHPLERGDLYLLCCDGLWGSVAEQTMADVLIGTPDLAQACESLIEAANEAGGPDNITAVLVRVT